MFKTIIIFLSFISFLITDLKAYAFNDLWQKTMELSEKSKTYRAKEIVSYIYDLNKDGTTKSVSEIHQKLLPGNKIQYETFKVIKDGKNITGKEFEKIKKGDSKHSFSDDTDIFSEEAQKKVSHKNSGNDVFNGIKCTVFDVVYKKDEKINFKGKAWINESNASPVKFSFTFDPLPFGMKKIVIEYFYAFNGEKYYFDKVLVEGKAGILFFEKNFKMKSEFRNY